MAIVFRWTILVVAFLFLALLYGISKEIFPPSFLTGAVRGIIMVLIMTFVWNITKKIGNKNKDGQKRKLFSAKYQPKEDITSNTQDMTVIRSTQFQKATPHKPTIKNKVPHCKADEILNKHNKITSKEKASLENLRDEGILTATEFTEKMAIAGAKEKEEEIQNLLKPMVKPLISKLYELKNSGILDEQECKQKEKQIIMKCKAEIIAVLEDNYDVMNMECFDCQEIVDKKIKIGVITTKEQEMDEIFRLQEKQEELVENKELCSECFAFRKLSDKKCAICGHTFKNDDIRECPKCGMENRIQKISVGFIQKCDECGNIDYFKEKPICETSWKRHFID